MHASFLRLLVFGLSATLGFTACGSSDTDQPTGGSGGGGGVGGSGGQGGVGGLGGSTGVSAYGLFDIQFVSGSNALTKIEGFMYDGQKPEMVIWDKKKTDGDCSLYTPSTPFCEACNTGEICVGTNTCRAEPLTHNVGAVTISGLTAPSGASPLPITKVSASETAETGVTYICAETLPMPACTAGGAISLAASGGSTYPAFTIQAQCIAPLVVTSSNFLIETGKGFALAWTPGSVAGARIQVKFDLSHHGGSKGQIRCDTADSGSLQVSTTLMDSLVALGVTGYPSIYVSREYLGKSTVGSGQAQLKVYSDLTFTAEIPGIISCDDDSDCPTDQTCLKVSNMCGIACTVNTDCPTGQTCDSSTKSCK